MSILADTLRDPDLATEQLGRLLDAYPLAQMSGKRVFMTGATGFIGSWLLRAVAQLNLRGSRVSVHALSRDPARFLARHPYFAGADWLSFTKGDVRDYTLVRRRFDLVIHGATDTSPDAAARALELFETMIGGTQRVLRQARASGAGRVLVLSSGAIYGERPAAPGGIDERSAGAFDPSDPADVYGEGKRAMEMQASCYGREHGIETVIARCFAFAGHGLPRHLAIAQLVEGAADNGRIVIRGDGKAVRSYLDASDLAVWLLALAVKGRSGAAYNVGASEALSIEQLAARICSALGIEPRVEVRGEISTQRRLFYVPDISRICNELGVSVWTDLDTSIRRMAAHCRGMHPNNTRGHQ